MYISGLALAPESRLHPIIRSIVLILRRLPPRLPYQTMTDVVGNPEEERRAEFYFQPWAQEAVCRYFYSKVTRRSPCSLALFTFPALSRVTREWPPLP